jgi:TolB-like protein/Flp pilus assembly protein TadD
MGGAETSFGPFVLDRGRSLLLREGKPVPIGQRALALLVALAETDGSVSKQGLLEAGWPGTIVEEGNLTVQIAALRKVLGAREDGSEWIVTVPRVGYRLVRAAASPTTRAGASTPRLPSIAVLPFQNLSSDPEQDYFADGIVESIITGLSRFSSIMVVARNSSFVFRGKPVDVREAARQLGARYVLEGSVQRAGQRLRITAQLVDGDTGGHLWADRYDGATEDVFAVQDRITESVVALVEPRIKLAEIERTRLKPPSSLDAYDLYLQALSIVLSTEPGTNSRAIELIERSLAFDPEFPPALAVAATTEQARFDRGSVGTTEETRRRGLDYAHRALASPGADANTRAQAGLAIIVLGQEYDSGIAALRQAAADNPNSVSVLGCTGVGALRASHLEEAEQYFLRAIQLNPGDVAVQWVLGGMAHIRVVQERFDEAIEWAHRSRAIAVTNPITLWFLIVACAKLGRLEEARRWRAELDALVPGSTLERIRMAQAMRDPRHLEVLIEGLRLAGIPER